MARDSEIEYGNILDQSMANTQSVVLKDKTENENTLDSCDDRSDSNYW